VKRRSLLHALAALPILANAPTARAAGPQLREGIDFVRLGQPLPQSQTGIEVIEFFSYGCPHCHEFEPAVRKWRSTLPKDVRFRRVPISFGNPKWQALAKLYLAVETTGDLAKIDDAIFRAVHEEKLRLSNDKAVIDWAVKRVADPKKFTEMYQSFGIQTTARSAEQTGADFGISGVPSFGVAGKYLVVAKEAKTREDILDTVDKVIAMARQAPAK
jgi:protein dithiol oxidoreductase (disulfide-forming)